jgi:catechol 2,3-dioxygenase-like lactoylglutathione lyase family enzyme
MPTAIDHVIILVDDLESGIEQYRELGFTVTPGGKHPRFTHNALITFADESYLELIAFHEHPTSNEPGETHRWYRHVANGGGLIDYALATPNLDTAVAGSATHGAVTPGARKRLDGIELEWKSAMATGDPNVGALPFLIEDVTDRGLRVPAENATHANGVTGIHSLIVGVENLEAAVKRYCQLLDREGPSAEGLVALENASSASFELGPHRIDLVAQTGDGPLATQVQRRGEGPFQLSLLAADARDIDPATAGNARLTFVAG